MKTEYVIKLNNSYFMTWRIGLVPYFTENIERARICKADEAEEIIKQISELGYDTSSFSVFQIELTN